MRAVPQLRLWLLALLLAAIAPAQAEVRAWLDRSEIALGESVTLNVQVDAAGATQPDFRALERDFEVLGTSSSSQISINNGQRSASTLFAVALSPKQEGLLTVPSVDVGSERTEPLVLKVTPSTISNTPGGDLFIEVDAQPRNPYVQQEVIYTLRLFYAVTLLDGQLDAPTPDGARMVRLGDDARYQVERGGRRYLVAERKLALIPERSGTLTLAAPRFTGRGMDRNGVGGMFGGGVRLAAQGQPLELNVRAKPASGGKPWLPARNLELNSVEPPLPDSVNVGEPVSITLRLRAAGLAVDQLPELTLPPIEGATVYPDQETSRDLSTPQGLAAEKLRRFAIVPTRPGRLELPALGYDWWDTEQDSARRAELAARSLRISGSAPIEPPAPATDAASPESALESAPAARGLGVWRDGLWLALCAVLALGWAWTAWRARRRPVAAIAGAVAPTPVPPRPAALRAALRDGDLGAIAAALRAAAPVGEGTNLSAVAEALELSDQRAAVLALERALYGADANAAPTLTALRAAFSAAPRWQRPSAARRRDGNDALPPLYR